MLQIGQLLLLLSLTIYSQGYLDGGVSSFRVESVSESGQITFAWDLLNGISTSSYISYYRLFYLDASSTSTGYYSYLSFSYSSTSRSGTTVRYTTTVNSFRGYFGTYIMWLLVGRSNAPSYLYSNQIYVEIGNQVAFELKILLNEKQSCSMFTETFDVPGLLQGEVYRNIRIHGGLPYTFTSSLYLKAGYVLCQEEDFITYRALATVSSSSYHGSDVIGGIKEWLGSGSLNSTVRINNRLYPVTEGACSGVKIPCLYTDPCKK